MFKIDSLLNPADSTTMDIVSSAMTPPLTPAEIGPTSPELSAPVTRTPAMLDGPHRQKQARDGAVFQRRDIKGLLTYPPFEIKASTEAMASKQHQKLAIHLLRHSIFPDGAEGQSITDYSYHIPYSSDKRDFAGKTGLTGLEVFHYVFRLPSDDDKVGQQKQYEVMWDYQVGLVRMTPFFKACKHSKTTPAKALNSTFGLRDLCHSITGGAITAQGYWVPYRCARALCLTFCYPIRFALVPIFGPSFPDECVLPEHANFGDFKIDPRVVQEAGRDMQSWKTGLRGAEIPQAPVNRLPAPAAPRSAPINSDRKARIPTRPEFRLGSPFESDSDTRGQKKRQARDSRTATSPEVSPRSTSAMPATSLWCGIKRLPDRPARHTAAFPPVQPRDGTITRSQRKQETAGPDGERGIDMLDYVMDLHPNLKRKASQATGRNGFSPGGPVSLTYTAEEKYVAEILLSMSRA